VVTKLTDLNGFMKSGILVGDIKRKDEFNEIIAHPKQCYPIKGQKK